MNTLQIKELQYTLGEWEVIKNLSYEFNAGGVYGILAPVEDQISYLLKIMGGIVETTNGTVLIDGVDIHNGTEAAIRDVRKKLSFVFARGGILSNLSIQENLLLPLDFHYPEQSRETKITQIKEYFEKFSISERILFERPAGLHPQMAKMLLLIRAFVLKPSVLLYDNPLADLELRYKKLILMHILELKKDPDILQIFVSTSDSLFEMADNNLVFHSGSLIQEGSWDDLIISGGSETQKIIREYLEVGINET